jgi:hypothetical protein
VKEYLRAAWKGELVKVVGPVDENLYSEWPVALAEIVAAAWKDQQSTDS